MDDTTKQILKAAIRHGLTTAAGGLVTYGIIHSSQTDEVVSAGMLLLGIAWSVWQKYGQAKAMALLKIPGTPPATK